MTGQIKDDKKWKTQPFHCPQKSSVDPVFLFNFHQKWETHYLENLITTDHGISVTPKIKQQ